MGAAGCDYLKLLPSLLRGAPAQACNRRADIRSAWAGGGGTRWRSRRSNL